MKRVVILLIVLLAALPAAASDRSGARWLLAHGDAGGDGVAADTIVALRAAGVLTPRAGRVRAAALRRGAPSYVTGAGQAAKIVLGLAASGSGSARCAGRQDLRLAMGHDYSRGRYGRNAFDMGLALLALRALRDPAPPASIAFLRGARAGAGWNVLLRRSGGPAADVSSTAITILGLRAAGVPRSSPTLRGALAWMLRQRTRSGGFALGRRDRNEANSTALAIEAERAMGRGDARAVRALSALQRGDGSFEFTATDAGSRVLATTESVLALSGRVPPVAIVRHHASGCR